MNVACVIGNGPSRKFLNLFDIHRCMKTYGCNAIYRDFIPHNLISMDIYMVKDIIGDNIHYKTNFYTQHTNKIDELADDGHPIHFFHGKVSNYDSGNAALYLATKRHDIVYMIGFDYMTNDTIANVYAGTKNYHNEHQYPAPNSQDTRWKSRLQTILKEHNNCKVVRVTGTCPKLNLQIDNFIEITTEQFKEELYGIYA